jgi:isopentenyl-diphosphate delta-isomerase
MSEQVILVDKDDNEVGQMEKLAAHEAGELHRAFSVVIINSKRQMLIHKRAAEKYHCPNLWTNACCSHPRPGESIMDAAHRRMKEELNADASLRSLYTFQYKAEFDNGLTEHELDHVLLGWMNDTPIFNTKEVSAVRWIEKDTLMQEMEENPEMHTPWFLLIAKELDAKELW